MKKCVNFNGDHQCVDCFCFSQMKIRVKTQREDRTPPKFHVVNDRSDSFKWILVTQEWLWLPLLRSVFFKMFLSVSTPSMSFSFNNLLQKATCPTLSQEHTFGTTVLVKLSLAKSCRKVNRSYSKLLFIFLLKIGNFRVIFVYFRPSIPPPWVVQRYHAFFHHS
jgi:hypothetical protein